LEHWWSQWRRGGLSQWLEFGGVGLLYRVDRPNHSRHPGNTWTSERVQESGTGGVNPPLAADALDRGLPNLTGVDEARIFGICWTNRGGAGVRVGIAGCKQFYDDNKLSPPLLIEQS